MTRNLRAGTSPVAGSNIPSSTRFICRRLIHGLTFALASLALVIAGDQADAEMFDAWVDSDEITFESDRYWSRANVLSGLSHSRTGPRVAMRNEEFVLPSSSPVLVQPQPSTGDSGLPIVPQSSNIPPPANQAAEPKYRDGDDVQYEPLPFPEELKKQEVEQKKPEKLTIPDFAKGLVPNMHGDDRLTFTPGLRMTPRYNYETTNGNNDLFIRRFRLKGSGSAYGVAKYGAEIKIDNPGRFEVSPVAIVENAWLDFPVVEDEAYLRAGRFDVPMSRNELTSDSKLLLMDRALIKEALTGVGMADKQYGVMLHGRPDCGRWEYDVGIFDSNVFENSTTDTRETNQLMPAARVTYSFLDPPTALDGYADYWESYIGKGQRLDVAVNSAYLGGITDGLRHFNQTGLGTDVFFNIGPFTFQAEYDWILQDQDDGAPDALIHGWYAQWGYLVDYWCEKPCTEFAVRYQTLDSDLLPETLRWTSVGFNFYIRQHNLKVQTDYTFRQGDSGTLFTMMQEDVFQVQLQLDF